MPLSIITAVDRLGRFPVSSELILDEQRKITFDRSSLISDLISHHHGHGVRTVSGDDNRPTLDTASTQLTDRQTTKTTDGSMQYLHYAARSDDDNQYRDHDDYDSNRSVVGVRRRVGKPLAGVTGPVHTYIKTDKNANFKWGVRHFAGKRYGG